ncbi:hypothetical protein Pcac1_g27425 [Phytophthora cactorum]|uniref:RxLR effector protein n=1 Tax=Phytophthora cactorum TaxID=29920 RepID=A0A8T0YB33_9STRA|nr:hypothetical protein Pcac1_g27425 [Phytophthora cactorum]KAG2848284.1 hypothetical protein PC113_g17622 [Phytophthora cactorum]KAG2897603.1 hypothetical protein PC115_g17127 [Phytophthora cactorum]KAG3164202.1 hypothetical protein PC128_g20199 [Phytophthora cactorum]
MQLYHILLVALFAILGTGTISAETSHDDMLDEAPKGTRLRVSNGDSLKTEENDERSIFSSIKESMKRKYWVSFDKSDDYPYRDSGQESRELDDWIEEGLTLYGAWTRLKLDQVTPTRVMQTDAYKIYVRYVKKYDSMIYNYKNSIGQPPIEFGGTDAQIFAKVQVWAAAHRPRWYVKKMLKLDDLPKSELVDDKFYKEFLRLTGEKS